MIKAGSNQFLDPLKEVPITRTIIFASHSLLAKHSVT